MKIQLLFPFFKVVGGKSILAFFGLLWPSFSATGSPGVAQKYPMTVFPCYTYGNPCPNIRGAWSINFLQFLNTPTSYRLYRIDINFNSTCLIVFIAHDEFCDWVRFTSHSASTDFFSFSLSVY